MNFADMVGFNGVSTAKLDPEVQKVMDELIGRLESFRNSLVSQLRSEDDGSNFTFVAADPDGNPLTVTVEGGLSRT